MCLYVYVCSRCNILISGKVIKEMPVSAASGTSCITQSVCVFVALGIQQEMRIRHIVMCALPYSTTIFLHYLIKDTVFGGRGGGGGGNLKKKKFLFFF